MTTKRRTKMKATKKYKVLMNVEYDFDTSAVDEWEDNGDAEINYITSEGIKNEIISWLEDLGFRVEIEVTDNDH